MNVWKQKCDVWEFYIDVLPKLIDPQKHLTFYSRKPIKIDMPNLVTNWELYIYIQQTQIDIFGHTHTMRGEY